MKQSNNFQLLVILAIVALLIAVGYWWFLQPGSGTVLEPTPAPMEERAAPIEEQSDLNAAESELDSTNLGEVDTELQDINAKISY